MNHHACEMRRLDPVDVGQYPPQVLDGIFLVDGLDLVEEPADRIFQLRVNVERKACLRNFGNNAAPEGKLIGLRIGLNQKHRIVQRPINAFTEGDVIEVVVPLKQFHLRDLGESSSNLLRSGSSTNTINTKNPDVQLPLIRPSPINR